MWFATGMR